jgi:hypothetical protein
MYILQGFFLKLKNFLKIFLEIFYMFDVYAM